jgi:acetyltransferase
MATDAVGDAGLSLASFSEATLDELGEDLPETANIYNPVDVIGDADVDRFASAIDTALSDPNVGAACIVSCPVAVLTFEELAEVIVEKQAAHGKPVAVCLMGGDSAREAIETLNAAGIPAYFDPARAIRSLDALREFRDISTREYDPAAKYDDVDPDAVREILQDAADRGETRIGVEAMDLLSAYGIPVPDGAVVDSPDDAREVAASIEGDVVMKVVSPDILHKSDIGGVRVGVPDDEVAATYDDLVQRARTYQPDAHIIGVQVQELLDLDASVETIVGINRDPQFGPLVLFGLGGIFVEVLEDTTVRVAPLSEREASGMIDDVQAAPLLRGARGRDPVDEPAVVETIGRLSQLATDFPAILELDVNPLVATADGATAVDVRLTIDPDEL